MKVKSISAIYAKKKYAYKNVIKNDALKNTFLV